MINDNLIRRIVFLSAGEIELQRLGVAVYPFSASPPLSSAKIPGYVVRGISLELTLSTKWLPLYIVCSLCLGVAPRRNFFNFQWLHLTVVIGGPCAAVQNPPTDPPPRSMLTCHARSNDVTARPLPDFRRHIVIVDGNLCRVEPTAKNVIFSDREYRTITII